MASASCHPARWRLASWLVTCARLHALVSLSGVFLGGVFSANFVSGVLGRQFPTPFASPPFRGLSSARVNVLYGLFNLGVVHTLLSRVGDFTPRSPLHAGAFGIGLGVWSLMITRSLGRLERGAG